MLLDNKTNPCIKCLYLVNHESVYWHLKTPCLSELAEIMMWTAITEEENNVWEPFELVVLKQKLAKLSCNICKCISDRLYNAASTSKVHINPNDKNVQVGRTGRLLDQFTQINRDVLRRHREDITNSLTTDVLCPSCYVTMNLLRGRAMKILKDEESETNAEMFSSDKSTEKHIDGVDETTSYSNYPMPSLSSVEHGEVVSDNDKCTEQGMVKRTSTLVKFGDVTMNSDQQTDSIDELPLPCLCLQRFVDSIRPPFTNVY